MPCRRGATTIMQVPLCTQVGRSRSAESDRQILPQSVAARGRKSQPCYIRPLQAQKRTEATKSFTRGAEVFSSGGLRSRAAELPIRRKPLARMEFDFVNWMVAAVMMLAVDPDSLRLCSSAPPRGKLCVLPISLCLCEKMSGPHDDPNGQLMHNSATR